MALPTPLQAFSGVPKINTAPDKQTIVDGEKLPMEPGDLILTPQ